MFLFVTKKQSTLAVKLKTPLEVNFFVLPHTIYAKNMDRKKLLQEVIQNHSMHRAYFSELKGDIGIAGVAILLVT